MVFRNVKETIKRENLIQKNDKILLALSGGADSICLLDILVKLRDEYNLTLFAAHLNHRIRGIDALKDSIYCQEICKKNNITFFVKNIDIPMLSKTKSKGIEEVARDERYKMLFDIKNKLDIDKIAVAHNIDDQAETIIMKMLRGSGMRGLCGIDYKMNHIIRPLLNIYKQDINKYCEENELNPRIDKTNFKQEYTRNKLRLDLIPYIEENYSKNIKQTLSRTANILRDDYVFLEKISKENYEFVKKSEKEDEVILDMDLLKTIDKAIQKRIIRISLKEILKNLNNIENIHIQDVISLLYKDGSKMINLPQNIKVYTRNNEMIITTKNIDSKEIVYSYKLNINSTTLVDELGLTINSKVLSKQDSILLPTSKYIKVFDYDKVNGDIYVRSRQIGDKINPIGMQGSKKIKEILIDMKIPSEEKYLYPILQDENDIMWLFGYRIAENYKIDAKTKNVLRLQYIYNDDRRQLVEKFI